MFELPDISTALPRFSLNRLPPAITDLGVHMAQLDLFEPSDLRTGGAGNRRMIEKAWERAFTAACANARAGYKTKAVPLGFYIVTPASLHDVAEALPRNHAWLVVSPCAGLARWYTHRIDHIAANDPECAGALVAMLFLGLNALCYAPKGPEFLAWARQYWWGGGEDCIGPRRPQRRLPGGLPDHSALPSRRKFNTRHPAWHATPAWNAAAIKRAPKAMQQAALRVEAACRQRNLLRPNAAAITGRQCGHFPIVVRARHDDYSGRLMDDHWASMERARIKSTPLQSAWPLETPADIQRAMAGLAPTCELITALSELINVIGYTGTTTMGYGYGGAR